MEAKWHGDGQGERENWRGSRPYEVSNASIEVWIAEARVKYLEARIATT